MERFEDVSLASGTGLYMNTMGIGLADIDRDGDIDMALSNIGGNKLLRSSGDGTFVEESGTGMERPNQGIDYFTITWGTAFYDLDLDGWEDLFMAAGNLLQGPDVTVGPQPNMVFLNDGTGGRFLDISALTGVDDIGDSKGVAFADFDRDGDCRRVRRRPGRCAAAVPKRDTGSRSATGSRSTSSAASRTVTDAGGGANVIDGGDAISRTALCGSGGRGSGNQHPDTSGSERRSHRPGGDRSGRPDATRSSTTFASTRYDGRRTAARTETG